MVHVLVIYQINCAYRGENCFMHISFYIWTINDKCKQNQRLAEKHQLWQWFMCTYDAYNSYLWAICIFEDSNKVKRFYNTIRQIDTFLTCYANSKW